jgi:hypothetical protein
MTEGTTQKEAPSSTDYADRLRDRLWDAGRIRTLAAVALLASGAAMAAAGGPPGEARVGAGRGLPIPSRPDRSAPGVSSMPTSMATEPNLLESPTRPWLSRDHDPVLTLGDGAATIRAGGKAMADFGWIDDHGLEREIGADLEDRNE